MKRNSDFECVGWYSRGYIPHFDQPGKIQVITIRLYDAVPQSLIEQWKEELNWAPKVPAMDPRNIVLRKRIEKYEDAGCGACWLGDDRIAAMVQSTILLFDGKRYSILAWCIMPNHVHTVIEIWAGYPLKELCHSWKSYTAHEANKVLGRSGIFWFPEYFDRWVRDEDHLANAVSYTENNPVKAGLVKRKEDWRWSSAWNRAT